MNTKTVTLFDLDDTLAWTSSMNDGIARPIDEKMEIASHAPALPLAAVAAVTEGAMILTARTDRPFTHAQLSRMGLAHLPILFRADGDNRVDHKVKADHVKALMAAGANIVKAYDDKVANVIMFMDYGIDAELVRQPL